MKKFIMLSALVAATSTAFVACSSDDDLAQQPKAPETIGTPVKVVLDGTRANLDNTTTANLSSFQLYGVQQTATKNFWMDNVQFTKSGTEWGSTSNPTWPVTNKDVTTNFYGFADGVTNGTPAGVTPSITADAQSFTFTFGAGTESSQWFAKWSETEGAIQYGGAWSTIKNNQGLRNEATLKSTATVLNNANLTDLLVTKDDVTGTEGTDGSLTVNFKHALSNLVIKAMFVGDDGGAQWPDNTRYYIQWIRVHGLYHTATYTFGTGWSIDLTNDSHDCAYEHVWGESDSADPDPRWTMDIIPYTTYNGYSAAQKKASYVDIVPEGEFMVIPQTISSYKITNPGGGSTLTAAQTAGQCYIEMYGYFHLGTQGKATSYNTNGQTHYYPLILNNAVEQTDGSMQSTFVAGKKHVVVIDLTSVLMNDGSFAANPSQAGGN
jgi:hypothetical protein